MVLFYEGTNTFKGWFDFRMQYIELVDIDIHLIFKQFIFAWADAHGQAPQEIHFIYLGSKEIYRIFKTCCIFSCFIFHKKLYTL
jgi:hypothetical protein